MHSANDRLRAALPGLLALALCACGPKEETPLRWPNVIIYMVDTLRHDHLSISGYRRDTTPNLAAFAEDAVVFENAYSTSSWTRPATASLLTGLPPHDHGAVTLENRVSEDVELLSESLRSRSYATSAFVANVNVTPSWGFDQGFDWFDDVPRRTKSRDAEDVVASAVEHLADQQPPLFTYLHTIDPHGHYDPPAPFGGLWADESRPKQLLSPQKISSETDAEDLAQAIALYDGEIAYNDHHFGELIAFLKSRDLYDSSLIFFVSDHGEEHVDHGLGGHGHTLYEEVVRVPLVVKFPGSRHAGTRVRAPASLLDVVPTALSALGEALPDGLEGVPLEELVSDPSPPERPLFFNLDKLRRGETPHVVDAVLYRDYKLIRRSLPQEEETLYSLAADPGESRDLSLSHPEPADLLRQLIDLDRNRRESGISLRIVNEPQAPTRVYRGRLTTTGTFVDVQAFQFEEEDAFELHPDRRTLTLRVTSRNYESALPLAPSHVVDEDTLLFQVDPPDAELTVVRFTAKGRDGVPLYVGDSAQRPTSTPLTFRADAPELQTTDPARVRTLTTLDEWPLLPGGYLVSIPETPDETVEVDEETRERLRALGYIR